MYTSRCSPGRRLRKQALRGGITSIVPYTNHNMHPSPATLLVVGSLECHARVRTRSISATPRSVICPGERCNIRHRILTSCGPASCSWWRRACRTRRSPSGSPYPFRSSPNGASASTPCGSRDLTSDAAPADHPPQSSQTHRTDQRATRNAPSAPTRDTATPPRSTKNQNTRPVCFLLGWLAAARPWLTERAILGYRAVRNAIRARTVTVTAPEASRWQLLGGFSPHCDRSRTPLGPTCLESLSDLPSSWWHQATCTIQSTIASASSYIRHGDKSGRRMTPPESIAVVGFGYAATRSGSPSRTGSPARLAST